MPFKHLKSTVQVSHNNGVDDRMHRAEDLECSTAHMMNSIHERSRAMGHLGCCTAQRATALCESAWASQQSQEMTTLCPTTASSPAQWIDHSGAELAFNDHIMWEFVGSMYIPSATQESNHDQAEKSQVHLSRHTVSKRVKHSKLDYLHSSPFN